MAGRSRPPCTGTDVALDRRSSYPLSGETMKIIAAGLFVVFAIASARCIDHLDSAPALILIAPGYLVQAWLFVRHRALGGLGYDLTIAGTSALFWTAFVVGAFAAWKYLVRHFSHRRES